jgi:hypothetical protein
MMTLSFHNIPAPQSANIFPSDIQHVKRAEIKHLCANKFIIEEIATAPHVGAEVSYLTTEPCPIKTWINETPSSNAPLKPGIAYSGSPTSIIDKNSLTNNDELFQAPTNPVFQRLDKSRTSAEDYIIISVHFPSAFAMASDIRKPRIAKIMVEFQAIEHCPAEFLLGRDALKACKMIIDEKKSIIWVNSISHPMKIPNTEGTRYDAHRIDRAFKIAGLACSIRPNSGSGLGQAKPGTVNSWSNTTYPPSIGKHTSVGIAR